MSLARERVVVVGGTSGMGAATVRAARRLGAEVVSAGRRPVAERDGVDGVHDVVVDSTDEASVRALFESVGELDHLLVTASPGQSGVFLEQDLAHARTFMDGKFLRAHAAQAALPPPLPRDRRVGFRVRAVLRGLQCRADGDAGGAGRDERRVDGRDRRRCHRPEAAAAQGRPRCAARRRDRRIWGPDHRGPLVGSRADATHVEVTSVAPSISNDVRNRKETAR
jgi:short chain dehydrogenase